ncbi:helix-turn-helix transcriptional regulator [Marinibactrum halimedae]|uniref:AraC family transcriptional regulator n=1 Tax=Marinibactrum halimedae TaxID=1444977 RepID=A0AA37T633_9GAMM|nr:AraC family transcriptional regulator [Marinibactrum halimedae]MCD9460151.1 AraC family transcriptional regulator [Marinibactrum halimedae]GLS26379.1 AraC family transcriptional regulator [Marinibactrum halimedae]
MEDLITLAKDTVKDREEVPFSVYSSTKEQKISNVPIHKPLLIFILGGTKKLGSDNHVVCPTGSFVFLSNNPNIDMRNIPNDQEYFAILIEFDYTDFSQLKGNRKKTKRYFQGDVHPILHTALRQLIELSAIAPMDAMQFRKKELLHLMYLAGYKDVNAIAEPPSISHQVHDIISNNITEEWCVERLASNLFMSESTLRRKLKSEGTDVKAIRTRARLGHGLHLIQTTMESVGTISASCGYQSQSRFTDQFKLLFGMTPSELRKTRMND